MGIGISLSDPGAVPGASTQARFKASGFRRGRNRFDGGPKGWSFARHDTAVVGSNL